MVPVAASSRLTSLRWIAIAWIVVFWRLGYPSLMDPDEAHYAELTREMVSAGNWLVPLLDGKPFIDKPVLFHWFQGASLVLLGESELAVRVPSALSALAVFAITRWVGIALLGVEAGEWGAILFATIPATFALARIGLMDMVFTTFLFGAVGCLLVAAREGRSATEFAGYMLLALAALTKGPVALLLASIFCATAWLTGGQRRARVGHLHWKSGVLLAAAVASPWFLWMYARFGDAFVQGYVLAGNLYYVTQPSSFSGRAIDHLFYVRTFAGGFFPWSAVALGRVCDIALVRRSRAALSTDESLLWIWSAIVVGFFSVARFKLDHYVFPAAPAVCLIAAKAWRESAVGDRADWPCTRVSILALAAALVFAGIFASEHMFELDLELPDVAILLPLVLAVGGVSLLSAAAKVGWRPPPTPFVPVTVLLFVWALVITVGFPTLERTRPTALIARTLRQKTPGDAPAGIYKLEQWRASLRYYAERPLVRLSTPEDVVAFSRQQRPAYVFMIRRDYRALRNAGIHVHEVIRCRAVVGTSRARRGLRRQHWDHLVLVTSAPRIAPGLLR